MSPQSEQGSNPNTARNIGIAKQTSGVNLHQEPAEARMDKIPATNWQENSESSGLGLVWG